MAEIFVKKPDCYLELEYRDTPRDANFWISGKCNFSCQYCLHGARKDDPARECLMHEMLSWEHFKKIADDLGKFPQKIRSASFCGIGEPTLHPMLPEMISYLKQNRIVDMVEVTTNGSLLTKELSLRLIGAGVDYLTVSIQGVTKADYERVCRNPLEPQIIADNVRWFHNHAFKTYVHVRSLDIALPSEDDKRIFMDMFGDTCDYISVANAVKMFQGMDYSGVVEKEVDQYLGTEVKYSGCCPLIFSTIHFLPNGDISPCPLPVSPLILGNVDNISLQEAWKSKERAELLLTHAKSCRKDISACANCTEPNMLVGNSSIPEKLVNEIYNSLNK